MLKPFPFVYPSYKAVPLSEFKARWPNFSPQEIACRGTGKVAFNFDAMDKLQKLREILGRPLIINSAFRSPEHNRAVGGAKASQHLDAKAFDIRQDNQEPKAFLKASKEAGFTGFGTYPKSNFIHSDIGPARTWGSPFPTTATALPVETLSQPETISEDKSAVGSIIGAAGSLTAGGAVLSSLGSLAPLPQTIAIIGLLVGIAAAAYVFRRRIKALA
jgi:zinc D-Ala-D-Ala carboxypeptidase